MPLGITSTQKNEQDEQIKPQNQTYLLIQHLQPKQI